MEYQGYEFNHSPNCGTLRQEQYVALIDALEEVKPERIIEFGVGQTTRIFEHYCQKYNKTLVSITHEERLARADTHVFPVMENSELTIDGRTYGPINRYYGLEEWLTTQEKFDFIVIDDPPGFGDARERLYTHCRIQVIDFPLLDKLADNAIIYYHDSERRNAKATLTELESILNEKNFSFERTQDRPDHSIVISSYRQMTKFVVTKNN